MTDMTDIERGLDRDRQALAETLNQLRGRIAPEALARDGMALAGAAGRAVRANPAGFAVAGVGLALIAYGFYRQSAATGKTSGKTMDRPAAARPEPLARWEDEGGATAFAPQQPNPAAARPQMAHSQMTEAPEADDDGWVVRLRDLQQGARARLQDLETAASREAAALRDGLNDGRSALRDYAAEQSALASDYLRDRRAVLAEGLHDLSDSARQRIIAAREKAWEAAERAEAAARDGLRRGGQAASDHPLLAAAISLGIGAATAALLPRSRIEDDAFGAESDRLMAEAARLLQDERARLAQVAETAGAELGVAARSALNRVAERTQEEMRRQHTGHTAGHRPNGTAH